MTKGSAKCGALLRMLHVVTLDESNNLAFNIVYRRFLCLQGLLSSVRQTTTLNRHLFVIFLDMDKQISWTVAAISEFAKAKALSVKQAFNYLSLFKGIDFLQAHYGAEHLLSFDDTVEDLTAICQRNGGQIQ